VNGMGSTTLMELFIVFRRVSQILIGKGIKIVRSLVGNTSLRKNKLAFNCSSQGWTGSC